MGNQTERSALKCRVLPAWSSGTYEKTSFSWREIRGAVTSCSLGKELNNLLKADTNTSVRGQTHSMEGKAAHKSYPKPKEVLMLARTKLPRLEKGQQIIACIQLMYECLTI